jgi:hypothetical protein
MSADTQSVVVRIYANDAHQNNFICISSDAVEVRVSQPDEFVIPYFRRSRASNSEILLR